MLDPAHRIPPRDVLLAPIAIAALTVLLTGADIGKPRAVAVRDGRAEADLATPRPGSKLLIIVSSLSQETGTFPIALTAKSKPAAAVVPWPTTLDPLPHASASIDSRLPLPSPPVVKPVWPSRRFHLLVRDGDVASAGNYLGVEARLAAVGKRVQIYVDVGDLHEISPSLLSEIVTTFDDRVYPLAAGRFGPAEDVDGDGRFTIFLTSWLNRLAGGRLKVDGFVRGADFDLELGQPFGNRCDMMCLSTSLRPGAHLKTVIAHEYTHAVRFSRKAFPRGNDGRLGTEEEGWLDEGLAHLVEDLHGFSHSNIDYRVSAFLSRPEKYRLVVEDYYAADLFRSHGNRGGTYLFLRWCVDRYGAAVLDRMIRSPLRGIANLEAATGQSFASLYREWTVALFLTGLDPNADSDLTGRYHTLDPRGAIEDWILAGPRSDRVQPDGPSSTWSAAGTTTHFTVVEGSTTGGVRIEVVGPPAADLQVTVVRLPDDLGGMDLDVRSTTGLDGVVRVRARVASQGSSAVRLGAIAWEPLIPAADSRGSSFRRAGLDMLGIARRFGTSGLATGGRLASQPITLDGVKRGDGPLVFKVVGTDSGGRRVAAWAEVDIVPEERGDGEGTSGH